MTTDVVAVIDELAAEEKCPHCDREWHELALTQSVARMFESGYLDADYFSHEDLSPIVCDGSTFIGPRRPEPTYASGGLITGVYSSDWTYLGKALAWPKWDTVMWSMPAAPWVTFSQGSYTFTVGGTPEPEPLECEPVPDGVEVEFGPQNWLPAHEPVYVPMPVKAAVSNHLHEFAAIETHAPEPTGYDFSQFDWEPPTYPKGKKGKK